MNRYDKIRERYGEKYPETGEYMAFLEVMSDARTVIGILENPNDYSMIPPDITMDWVEEVVDEINTNYPDGDKHSRIARRIELSAEFLESRLETRSVRRILGVSVNRLGFIRTLVRR
ncbi:hypothetical protein J4442_03325 [Candidatus Woesearchaeota archaeon]|nr:hypothetical protein [Candidatus Woesearchaeota archaeon]